MTSTKAPESHVAVGIRYCEEVVAGKIVACELTRLACQRQLDDLTRAASGDPEFPYTFDPAAGERACRFMELLPHVKGRWARRVKGDPTARLIRLHPSQAFELSTVFGWKQIDTGFRRFTTVYDEVARKNAKSTKSSGVALYMFALDDEPGAEVYCSATKRDQAKIVFDAAKKMAEGAPDFRLRYGVEVFAHTLAQPGSGSVMKALDAKGSTQDGWNVHCVINDELHAQKSRALYDVLHSAQTARDQPLEWNITTAGRNRSGVCYELRCYAVKVLEGTIRDETFFAVIYTLDKDDDWTDERVWPKANPLLGVSKNITKMRADCHKAVNSAASQNEFLTKDMNLWVNADTAWMNMRAWSACADSSLRIKDFEGEDCLLGLDLATKVDIASKVRMFRRGRDYYLFARHYLPQAALEKGENAHYAGWEKDGWLKVTPGNVIDLDLIEAEIAGDAEIGIVGDADRFALREVCHDPWQAAQMATHLMEEGLPVVEVRPTVKNFSEPMKEFEALVLDGRLHHDGDPVLTWMVSNVVCHIDAKDNIYPRKEAPENKIDGVIATIMALGRAMVAVEPEAGSIYEERDLIVV